MNTFLELLLIVTAFVSVIPVVNLSKNHSDTKYRCLKLLIYTAAFWTLIIFTERTSTNISVIYYANMLGYPIKFLLASLMFCTIFQYIEKRIPKPLILAFILLFAADFAIAMTNSLTNWFLELSAKDVITFRTLYDAADGPLFIYHLIISYTILLVAIVYMFVFLGQHKGVRQYKEVTITMAVSVMIVLAFNMLQYLAEKIYVNMTYISLIFVSSALYLVIYKRDMIFNLRTSGRGEILTNMREMYILADYDKRIVDVSPLLLEKYKLDEAEIIGKRFSDLERLVADKVVLYKDYDMKDNSLIDKDHYHIREKEFKLKGLNDYGYMILLYDETQVYKLLRELNRLSNFDSMTGLNNRNYIENKLASINDTEGMGVISLDLNGLKINNDYLGHERGDYLLKTLANHLKTVFQKAENKEIARIGGDEFLILVTNSDEKFLEKKKQEILALCNDEKIEKTISVSIGTAIGDASNKSIFQLIKEADEAMYDMKAESSKAYKKNLIAYIKMQDKFIR